MNTKIFIVFFAFTITSLVPMEGISQMSKKEEKEWKKRIKKLTPDQYKALLDDNKQLKSKNFSLKSDLAGVDAKIADKDDQIAKYENQVADLKSALVKAKSTQKKMSESPQSPSIGSKIDVSKGVVFKVQIGAFKNKDLSKYLDKGENFSGEMDDKGLRKYSLGIFRDYWEADTFKKYLREMGVKDAWIVSFRDGQRVPIKEVLENVRKS